MMKTIFQTSRAIVIVAGILVLFTACATKSTVSIPSSQTFVLGELAENKFTVQAQNPSDKPVQFLILDKSSDSSKREILLEPMQSTTIKAKADEKIWINNPTADQVQVNVKLSGPAEGMRYRAMNSMGDNYLERDSLIIELEILERALSEMHPGLYRYNSPDQIRTYFTATKNSLPASITEGDYMVRLAQLIAKIKCGHTYLNPWNMNPELRSRLFGGKIFIPLGFEVIEGRFYVTEIAGDTPEIKRGAELLEINGVSVKEIYKQLGTIAKTDGNNRASVDHYLSVWNYDPSNWHAFDLYYRLFYPLQEPIYTLKFSNYGEENVQDIALNALSKEDRSTAMATKYGTEVLERELWSLKKINEELAVMQLGTFATWTFPDFDHQVWFAEAFKQLEDWGIRTLAIDIRGNGGGLTQPANELISYLISEPVRCDDLGKVYIRTTKFSEDLLPYIDSGVDILKSGLPSELYREAGEGLYELLVPGECEDVLPKENRFEGQVYLFGGGSNVSATYTLLDKANRFGFASFIGKESGGNKQGINGGEYSFFTLPYSSLEVDIPLKYFAPATPRTDSGVKPQTVIKNTQENIAKGIDPFLEYIN